MVNEAVLLLGGNQGNVADTFTEAIKQVEKNAGKIIKRSSIYQTESWGMHGRDFLNIALVLKTWLSPFALLECVLGIEKGLGRERSEKKNSPRSIDIDILFFNNEVIETAELEIPHPRLHLRKFVLIPLNEIIPEYIHPVLTVPVSDLLLNCNDQLEVKRVK